MTEPSAPNKLKHDFPQQFAHLQRHIDSGGFLAGTLDEAAERVWHLAQMYLMWYDNGDGDMPVDPEVRRWITELAGMNPRCPIDDEVEAWTPMWVSNMTRFELALSASCVQDAHPNGDLMQLAGDTDHLIETFIQIRDRTNRTLASLDTTALP